MEPVLLLRLRLLQAREPSSTQQAAKPAPAHATQAVAAAAADATARCPGSYTAWCVAAEAQVRWQGAVETLQRGIVALADAGSQAAPKEGVPRAACVLDLALRLLATWTAAGQVQRLVCRLLGPSLSLILKGAAVRKQQRRCSVGTLMPYLF